MNWIDYTKQKPTDKEAQFLIYYRWHPDPDLMLVNDIAQWNGQEFYNFGWDDDIRYGDKVKYWMKIEEPTEE